MICFVFSVLLCDLIVEVIQYNSVSFGSDYGNVFRLICSPHPNEYAVRVQDYNNRSVGWPAVQFLSPMVWRHILSQRSLINRFPILSPKTGAEQPFRLLGNWTNYMSFFHKFIYFFIYLLIESEFQINFYNNLFSLNSKSIGVFIWKTDQ